MLRNLFILLIASSFCLLGQKPTLTDIDQGQKKAAADAHAAQKQAAQNQAESVAELKQAVEQLEKDKADEQAEAAAWHKNVAGFGREVMSGLTVAVVLGIAALGLNFVRDMARHKLEQRARDEASEGRDAAARAVRVQDAKTDQIHVLVNSKLTSALRAQLAALQLCLNALLRVVKTADATPDDRAAIETVRQEMAGLSAELVDRLSITAEAADERAAAILNR